jgi:hypothetical protein
VIVIDALGDAEPTGSPEDERVSEPHDKRRWGLFRRGGDR